MGTWGKWNRFLGWLVVAGVLLMLVPLSAAAAPSASTAPSVTPVRPGDHQAEQDYFDSIRQAPKGTDPAHARLAAIRQAQGLPSHATLPPATRAGGSAAKSALNPPTGPWQQLGPAPQDSDQANPNNSYRFGKVSGRGTALVIGPTTGIMYEGTADGGLWKSTDGGVTWTVKTDSQPSLAVGALALDATDATDKTIYIGTGESNHSGDAYFGVGVLKSTDGGDTWSAPLGASVFGGGTYSANSFGIDVMTANGASVFAGTQRGLYHSSDGGATWTQVTVNAANLTQRVTDLAVDGSNVYAVLSNIFALGNPATNGVYKSTTGGGSGTFTAMNAGLPTPSTWGRTRLAMANSAPTTLYLTITTPAGALLEVDKTTNGGTSWVPTTTQPPDYFSSGGGSQGWYDTDLVVDPANANNVYAGGILRVGSTDGGATWAIDADVYCGGAFPCHGPIHPDQHASVVYSGSLYVANDGGVWKSSNPTAGTLTTWASLNANIASTQFYAGDAAATSSVVVGGAQDNGTSLTTSPSLGLWGSIFGGDGGYVAIDKSNFDIEYVETQNGNLVKTTNATAGTSTTYTHLQPALTTAGCGTTAFIAPFTLDPNLNSHLAFGARFTVCETRDGGGTWHASNTNPFSGAGRLANTQSVAIAPSNSAVIYAGTTGGKVYRTIAGNAATGTAWTDISTGLPSAPATAIAIDGANPDTAYVTFGNFGVGHVWKTVNGGTSWTNITGTLPDIPTTSIVTYASTPNPVLVVGTDIGVYVSADNGGTWTKLDATHLPNVGINQLFTDQAQTTLFAATHGRGMWKIGIPNGAALVSIAVTATSATIPVGGTDQFTATCTFTSGPPSDCSTLVTWASDTPAVATINAAGLATGVSAGMAKITATLGAITSPPSTLTVTGGVTTTLTSSANPSTVGQSVTFTATVTGTGGTPTGTVTFKEGATSLGTGTLSGSSATFATSTLTQGSHIITAIYGGDATFAASTSAPLTQVVNAVGPSPTGLQFYPLAKPVRLLDTRAGATAFVAPNASLTAGQTLSLPGQFSYQGVTIPATAQAIVGNATVANGSNGTPPGFATIFPSGLPLPLTSNLNFVPGTVRPNDFTVALGSDTKFNLYSSSGGDFVVDISGYYAPVGAGGLYFHPLAAPVRELDTRSGATAFVHPNATLTAGQTLTLPGSFTYNSITIPASAKALVGNATVANGSNGTPAGFATLYPDDVPLPLASNLNFVPGTVAPNAFTVALGGGGGYKLYSSTGGDFVVDITGYLDTTAAGGLLFTPLSAPVRELDTRAGATAFVHPSATLTAGQTLNLPGSFTYNSIAIPASAKALVGNATVANDGNATSAGFATLYPAGVPLPLASNLNFVPKQVAPNAITVGIGADGTYNLYTSSGGDFIIDITGFFS